MSKTCICYTETNGTYHPVIKNVDLFNNRLDTFLSTVTLVLDEKETQLYIE